MTSRLVGIALCTIVLPTLASEPGQPLDCSDWTIVAPGIICRQVAPYPCEGFCDSDSGTIMDNESNTVRLVWRSLRRPRCGNATGPRVDRLELIRVAPDASETVIAYAEERCAPDGTADTLGSGGSWGFDPVRGILRLTYTNRSLPAFHDQEEPYESGARKLEFVGFPTLREVLELP